MPGVFGTLNDPSRRFTEHLTGATGYWPSGILVNANTRKVVVVGGIDEVMERILIEL